MSLKYVTAAMVMAAMTVVPTQRVQADEFVGGLVGGIIGGAIGSSLANQNNNKRTKQKQRQRTTTVRTRTVYVNPQVTTAQRQQARDIQTSLNYFGFNAGYVDGVIGGQSRAAISRMQSYLGYPATGQLSAHEQSILLGAYQRGVAGGADVNDIIASSPDGVRGLLIAQRDGQFAQNTQARSYAGLPPAVSKAVDEVADSSDPSAEQLLQRSGFIQLADLNGDGSTDFIIDTSLSGSSFWCNATACKTMVFASTANGYVRNDLLMHSPTPEAFDCIGGNCRVREVPAEQPSGLPETQLVSNTPQDTTSGTGLNLPVFNTAPQKKSLAAYCNKVNLLTSANGGYTTVSSMTDADFTLNEQMCLTTASAVAQGEALIASVQGVTPAQIEAQCDAFGLTMEGHIAALATKSANAVLNDVSTLVLNSGMTPAQLRTTAQICMASGYQADKMQAALGGALLMTALGDRPVAELVGHHLHGGFGTAKNDDLAIEWYNMALDALDDGATPVFAVEDGSRIEVLRQATQVLSGLDAAGVPGASQAAMPVFTVAE